MRTLEVEIPACNAIFAREEKRRVGIIRQPKLIDQPAPYKGKIAVDVSNL